MAQNSGLRFLLSYSGLTKLMQYTDNHWQLRMNIIDYLNLLKEHDKYDADVSATFLVIWGVLFFILWSYKKYLPFGLFCRV